MDIESLREQASAAQAEAHAATLHKQEIGALAQERIALEARLGNVTAEFGAIFAELGDPFEGKTPLIGIEKVADKPEESGDIVQPGGIICMRLVGLTAPNNIHDDFERVCAPGQKVSAFKLQFVFVSDDHSRGVTCESEETTLGPNVDVFDRIVVPSERMQVERFRGCSYTDDNARKLRQYADVNFAARAVQVDDLEKSLAILKVAIEDDELNPGVAERRALNAKIETRRITQEEFEAKEAAKLAEQDHLAGQSAEYQGLATEIELHAQHGVGRPLEAVTVSDTQPRGLFKRRGK